MTGEPEVLWDELRRTDRKTLAITVRPDRSVLVRAPSGTSEEEVRGRVWRRRAWIKRQQKYFSQFEPRVSPRQFVSGESHLYRGRRYRLKVLEDTETSIRLHAGYIEVRSPTTAPFQVEVLLNAWYRERAEAAFPEVFRDVFERFYPPLTVTPKLVVQPLRHRWGTCYQDGRIVLNVELIKAPRICLEYVVAHELCHLVVPNHSSKFRSLLDRLMPDWRDRKARLEVTLARA